MDIVDKILSCLGIYDLVGVWLSGAIILYATDIMMQWLFEKPCMAILKENYFVAFLACYVIGLVFQEFTSFVHKKLICHSKNRYLINAITPSPQHYLFLEDEEIDTVNKYVSNKLEIGDLKRKDNIITTIARITIIKTQTQLAQIVTKQSQLWQEV